MATVSNHSFKIIKLTFVQKMQSSSFNVLLWCFLLRVSSATLLYTFPDMNQHAFVKMLSLKLKYMFKGLFA